MVNGPVFSSSPTRQTTKMKLLSGLLAFTSANFLRDQTKRWPDRELVVDFDYDLDPKVVGNLHRAMEELETKTSMTFKMVDTESYGIKFRDTKFSNNGVCGADAFGMIGCHYGVNVGESCADMSEVIRIIYQAFGIQFETLRWDRDNHVEVNYVDGSLKNHYEKVLSCEFTNKNLDYDYMSLLHFKPNEYAEQKDEVVVTPKDESFSSLIGQRVGLTENDVAKVDLMYADIDNYTGPRCNCDKIKLTGSYHYGSCHGSPYFIRQPCNNLAYERPTYYNSRCGLTLKYAWFNSQYQWVFADNNNKVVMQSYRTYQCPESITTQFDELAGSEWHPSTDSGHDASISCHEKISKCLPKNSIFENKTILPQVLKNSDSTPLDTNNPGEPENLVQFSWKIDPWVILWNGIENTEFYESPLFTTEEGYTFRVKVYLKGIDADSEDFVSIYVEQVADFEHDKNNVWPMRGKLITVGISEQEKPDNTRYVMTKSDVTAVWNSPSDGSAKSLGWKKFLSHEHLFYDSTNPSGWDFVHRDSMMFTLSVTDASGVFANCIPNNNFNKCRFHQDKSDSFDWDQNGTIQVRGIARISTVPIHQWGPRCLVFKVETEASITIGVSGKIKYEGELYDYPYYRDRLHPTQTTQYSIMVNVGAEDFDTELQQRMQIEVINHEAVLTKFVSTKWYHGWCDDRFDHMKQSHNVKWTPKKSVELSTRFTCEVQK